MRQPGAAAAGGINVDDLPDFDNMDFSAPQMQPSIMSQGQVNAMSLPSPSSHHMQAASMNDLTAQQKNSPWFLQAQDKERCMKMLGMFDKEHKGTLTAESMQQIIANTKLDQQTCSKVWQLSNPNSLGEFDVKMFSIAMHLLYRKRADNTIQLPDKVPLELELSAQTLMQAPMQQQPMMQQPPQMMQPSMPQ